MKIDTILRNNQIKAGRVVVIGDDGNKVGEFLRTDAISMAEELGLDLVQVGGQDINPICKIMDYGKLLYEKKKKQKGGGSAQVKVKELKFGPNTDDHDMAVRHDKAKKFIEQGDRVKITVRFKGRESTHLDIVRRKCLEFAESLKDIAEISQEPKLNGRQMIMLLTGKKDIKAL